VRQWDVEEPLVGLSPFEVVFCYGTLYHLENPVRALRNMADVCDELLLLETLVCDSPLPVARLDDETLSLNQALRGMAIRPSVAFSDNGAEPTRVCARVCAARAPGLP
jgi:hypothetical protein